MPRLEAIIPPAETVMYLVNLAVAVSLVCGVGLLAARVCRHGTAPLRHGVLVWTLVLILVSPAAVWLAERNGPALVRITVAGRSDAHQTTTADQRLASPADERWAGGEGVAKAEGGRGRAEGSSGFSMAMTLRANGPHPSLLPEGEGTDVTVSPEEARSKVGEGASMMEEFSRLGWWRVTGSAAALLWAIGTALGLCRLVSGCAALVRFCRRLDPLSDPRQKLLVHQAADAVGLRKLPTVFLLHSAGVPVSIGLLSPAIVLPQAMLREADREQLQAVLLHEMAHIARRDHWVGVGQRIAAVLFWWHPLVHRVCEETSDLREEICDNYVVLVQGEGQRLARILVDLAARVTAGPLLPSTVGVMEPRLAGLTGRVSRLLDKERNMETRMNLRSRVFLSSCSLVVLIGIATVGGLRLAQAQPGVSGQSTSQQDEASQPIGKTRPDAQVRLSGVVRGPDGAAVAGAAVYLEVDDLLRRAKKLKSPALPVEDNAKRQFEPKPIFRIIARAQSDAGGRFSLEPQSLPAGDEVTRIVVAAKHFGLALQPWDGKPTKLEIRLPAMVLIEGRLLGPDRRPAADVVVKGTWLTRGSDSWTTVDQFLDEKDYPPYWPRPVRSDEHGGFTLNGVPAGYHVMLDLKHPSFAREEVRIDTGEGATERSRGSEIALLPPVFTHVLEPPRPVEGRVTAADTGKPLAGVLVEVIPMNRHGGEGIYTRTDAAGHFYVSDKAGEHYYVTVFPLPDAGYLAESGCVNGWPQGAKSLVQDFKLARGVLMHGRVVDGASGEPIPGASVEYHASPNNPNRKTANRDRSYEFRNSAITDNEGRFKLTGLGGAGYLTVETPERIYIRKSLAERGGSAERAMPMGYTPVEVWPLAAANQEVVVRLQRGRTVTLQAVGPNGERLPSVIAAWEGRDALHEEIWNLGDRFPEGKITVRGIDRDRITRVFMIDTQKKIGAAYDITANTPAGPVEVRLQPNATITGRAVGENGEPADVQADLMMCFDPQIKRLSTKKPDVFRYQFYGNFTDQHGSHERIPGGRFSFDNVLPGIPLSVMAAEGGNRSCTISIGPLRPGQRLDVGRVVVAKH
jgi:beta-lactamase regulating signal transducer with metallopeptidase domain/protocatechuate 3,4-dioxygenase beta subunit